MRRSAVIAAALICCFSSPAWAVKEWYDYYFSARDSRIPEKRYEEAVRELTEAIRLKPAPALRERTYGVQFVDYLPYYYLGLCHLRLERYDEAINMFNISQDRGAIARSDLQDDLVALRTEAQNAESQRAARLVRSEIEDLLARAGVLFRSNQYDEALTQLAQAGVAAERLDPEAQRRVRELQDQIREHKTALERTAERTRRIEAGLAQGRVRLGEGQPTEATRHFDEVLALDPANRIAQEGKRDAQTQIRAQKDRETLQRAYEEGKALFEAGRYDSAVGPLTDAAALPSNTDARTLLERTIAIREGLRQQRELAQKVDLLEKEADSLILAGSYAEARVRLDSLLFLDRTNVRAQERIVGVDIRIMEDWVSRFRPNRKPVITILAPAETEDVGIERWADSIPIVGVATDDRAVARLEFKVGDRVVGEQKQPPPGLDHAESSRHLRFDRDFLLEPGFNTITVTATDSTGLVDSRTFRIERRLRFYETRAFLPSAFGTALSVLVFGLGIQRLKRRRAVRQRFNPYIAGAPVLHDDMFFGRQKLLARILNVLHHNSLVITGERRIGKTTFLYHLKKALEADHDTEYRFFPVLTDLQGVPELGFFHALMSDIVDTLGLSTETTVALRFDLREEDYDGRAFSHDVRLVVDELKTRTHGHAKLALLIDEVDALNEYSERINQRLRSIFMKTFSEHLVAVMAGVGIKRTWKSEGSPWYNFFDEIELTALSRDEAEALIRTPVEGVFRYDAEAVESILQYTDLKPYLIQKFCIHAVNHIIEERRTTVTAADIEAVMSLVRFEGRDTSDTARATA
jgi:tetratricopeptide (TPR) repeat protein